MNGSRDTEWVQWRRVAGHGTDGVESTLRYVDRTFLGVLRNSEYIRVALGILHFAAPSVSVGHESKLLGPWT